MAVDHDITHGCGKGRTFACCCPITSLPVCQDHLDPIRQRGLASGSLSHDERQGGAHG